MIDIHSHLLFGVDDGPDTLEESVQMLKDAKSQGIDAIILTPHYRHGMFPHRKEQIKTNFEKLKKYSKKYGIQLYLGTEYHVNSRMVEYLESGRCSSLAGTKYVLTEYSYETEYEYIRKMSQELIFNGYTPVIAHVERYRCIREDINYAEELQMLGALIQVNADAILGIDGRKTKKFCKKALEKDVVDIVASDSHGIRRRVCHLKKCYHYIEKKYGTARAKRLLSKNPKLILKEEKE